MTVNRAVPCTSARPRHETPQLSLRDLFWLVLVAGCASTATVIPRDQMTNTRMTVTWVRVGMYAEKTGVLPDSLNGLPERKGYDNETKDGWGRPLVYSSSGDEFSLESLGQDGAPGGSGPNADVRQQFRWTNGKVEEVR